MPAFRLFSKLESFFGLTGQLLAGGELRFYEAGTSTPASVFGDKALSVNNGSTVSLDASGRPNVDVWGDAANGYKVALYDALGVSQGQADDIEIPGGAGQTIPIPNSGEFLTGDGSTFSVATIREVPDPTGQAGKVVSTDGTDITWIAKPADGAPGADASDVGAGTTDFHIGDMHIVTGTATGTSSGGRTQTVNVTFATAFTSTPVYINVFPTSSSLSSAGNMPSWSIISKSTTGFTVKFTMGELDDSQSKFNFNAGIAFGYMAMGVRTS